MAQFAKLGGMRINTDEIRAIQVDSDGHVYLHYGNRCDQVVGEDARALVEWADANLISATAPELVSGATETIPPKITIKKDSPK